jgi:DNA-binding response OmpR family regulator
MSEERPRLLVVEDETHLARAIKLNFELEGFEVDVAPSGKAALRELVKPKPPRVIVLDVALPDTDGFALCASLREGGIYLPVIMLTVRASAEDRVRGLEAGADDYLPKPFEFSELLARVRALIRRDRWARADPGEARGPERPRSLRFGRALVDFEAHRVAVDGKEVALTALELELVAYFAANPGRVLSRKELLDKVWGLPRGHETRTVDNFVARLRKHFEVDPSRPAHFLSHRGAGYRFEPGR